MIGCTVYEVLAPVGSGAEFERCAGLLHGEAYELAGERTEIALGVEVRREICRVRQVGRAGAGTEAGWFYDDGSAPGSTLPAACDQRISFSVVAPGAEVVLACPP